MEGITAKCLGCERDVPLKDIRQHMVQDCQEIAQHCGSCPAQLVRPQEEIKCSCGQQLLHKREQKYLKADFYHIAPWGVFQLWKGQIVLSLVNLIPNRGNIKNEKKLVLLMYKGNKNLVKRSTLSFPK